jgi:D-3-phosphoglycerate dehydrogenase
VKGLNIGIVGYGRLGKLMEHYCSAFGANTFVYDPYVDVPQTSLEAIFSTCDVVSLHVHVTDETKYMISDKLLGLSQKDLYIVNTSRGEIVNELEISKALESGKLAGYGCDVLEDEFGSLNKSPIISTMNKGYNVVITPHIGGMTVEGQVKAYQWAINKL